MEKKPVSPVKMQPYVPAPAPKPAPVAPIQQPISQPIMPIQQPLQECPPYQLLPICCPPIPCCPPPIPCCFLAPLHRPWFNPKASFTPHFYPGLNPWGY